MHKSPKTKVNWNESLTILDHFWTCRQQPECGREPLLTWSLENTSSAGRKHQISEQPAWEGMCWCWQTEQEATYRQLCEGRVADVPTEHLLLELQQLDHQAGQGFVGGGLSLDVLRNKRKVKVNKCLFGLKCDTAFHCTFTFICKRVNIWITFYHKCSFTFLVLIMQKTKYL